jgi:hypothetical protein
MSHRRKEEYEKELRRRHFRKTETDTMNMTAVSSKLTTYFPPHLLCTTSITISYTEIVYGMKVTVNVTISGSGDSHTEGM